LTTNRLQTRCVEPGHSEWPTHALEFLPEWSRPTQLWLAGPLNLADITAALPVALVGSAAASAYGLGIAADLARQLHRHQVPVITTAEFGVARSALQSVLDDGGAPVAVLACGLDRLHPTANSERLRKTAQTGLLITQAPPETSPSRSGRIERNRLTAALAAMTVVVEAGYRSSSLNTAAWARQAGRPVGAVPGPVTSATSRGCHRLIREGAALLSDAADIISHRSQSGVAALGDF
jgi:DNA processing protein